MCIVVLPVKSFFLVQFVPHLPGEGCWILCQLPPPASSSSSSSSSPPLLLVLLVLLVILVVLVVLVQLRPAIHSVLCRTSTTHAQCSLPDLNHDHPRPVFPAGPQPRVSMPSVPCRTSCRKIKCQIECQKICQIECQIECQKICQIECQKMCQ